MPTEQELRDNPLQQFPVDGETLVWYDADLDVFCAASADAGDAGDSFATYQELVESV